MNNYLNERKDPVLRHLGIMMLILTIAFWIAVACCVGFSRGTLELDSDNIRTEQEIVPDNDIIVLDNGKDGDFVIRAKGKGNVMLESDDGFLYSVKVLPGNFIYDEMTGNFSGFRGVSLCVQIYFLWMTILLLASFIQRCRRELFSYTTLYFGGVTIFMSTVALDLLVSVVRLFNEDLDYGMRDVYSLLKGAGSFFMLISMPLMLVFMTALVISNIKLIRREGRGFPNLLGFILAFCIFAGYAIFIYIGSILISGSEREVHIIDAAISVYTTTFVYFESMLLSSMICGLIAAKRSRQQDKTHIIILGCSVGDDGRPLPLLRGRVDRAIEFAQEQMKRSGKKIKFVPSGGKGDDEPVSEAESMKEYLMSKGVSEENIIPENRSASTFENMAFSKKLIEADCAEPKVVFSTSGYHVLRSGIISWNAGLGAEGVGCRTKWYFWPNAFVREFIGLLASKWRRNAFWVAYFIVVFVVMNMLIPL